MKILNVYEIYLLFLVSAVLKTWLYRTINN